MGRTSLDSAVQYWITRHELEDVKEARRRGKPVKDGRTQRGIKDELIALKNELEPDGGRLITRVIDKTVMRERNSTKSPVGD